MSKMKQSSTCIAAIKHRGKVYMATDSRLSWGMDQAQELPKGNRKIVKRDGLILAGTGTWYLCRLILQTLAFRSPEGYEGIEDQYFDSIFYNDVVKLLKSKGHIDVDSGLHPVLKIPYDVSAEIIMVLNGRLFTLTIENPVVEENHNPSGLVMIEELNIPYAAGCGGQLAWGSLLTTESLEEVLLLKPKERLKLALQVAAQVSPGCDENIIIENE